MGRGGMGSTGRGVRAYPIPSPRKEPWPVGFPFGSELGPDLSQMAPNEPAPRSPARKRKIRIMGALLEDEVSRPGALPEQPHPLASA